MSSNAPERVRVATADEVRAFAHAAVLELGQPTPEELGIVLLQGCARGELALPSPPTRADGMAWDDAEFGISVAALASTIRVSHGDHVERFWGRLFATAAAVSKDTHASAEVFDLKCDAVHVSPDEGSRPIWTGKVTVRWIGYPAPGSFRIVAAPPWEMADMHLELDDAFAWAAGNLTRESFERWARDYAPPDARIELERIRLALEGIG